MNTTGLHLERGLLELPNDVSQFIPKRTLIRLAFEAVDAANWPPPYPLVTDQTPEPVLRTLLSFCYVTGVFASSEIVVMAKQDQNIRYLCANDFPTFELIRNFRRQNISYLRETLARMLHAAWVAISPEDIAKPSFLPFLSEADRRIRASIEADSAALDD